MITVETSAETKKSTSLNKLQKASSPSKETGRGLQLKKGEYGPTRRDLPSQISPFHVKSGWDSFPKKVWEKCLATGKPDSFPRDSLLSKPDPVWLKLRCSG